MANRTLGNITTLMGLNNDAFKKGLSNSKKDVNKFTKSMKGLGTAIGGAFAIRSIARFALESSKLAAQMEGVKVAFDRIKPSIGFMNDLKKATAGTVNELDLMRRSVMASNFNIPLENLATLLKFATKRAQETGESVSYLVNSIVIGIGRKSPLILDNLGISAVDLRKKLEGVGHSGATVGQVSQAVMEIAEEALSKMGEVAETTAIKYERLNAEVTNMKIEFGETANVLISELLPALTKTVGVLGKIPTVIKKGFKGLQWENQLLESNDAAAQALEGAKWQILKSAPRQAQKNDTDDITETYRLIGEAIERAKVKLAEFNKEQDTWEGYIQGQVIKGLENWRISLEEGTEEIAASAGSINMLNEELKVLKEMFNNEGDAGKRKDFALEISNITQEIKDLIAAAQPLPEVLKILPWTDDSSLGGEMGPPEMKMAKGMFRGMDGVIRDVFSPERKRETKEYFDTILGGVDQVKLSLSQLEAIFFSKESSPFEKMAASAEIASIVLERLGNDIKQYLVSQVYDLGTAVGEAFRGMTDGLKSLGQEILKNIGYMLMMAGMYLLPINAALGAGLLVAGGALQLGGGLWKGLGNKSDVTTTGSSYSSQQTFRISGQDLVTVLGRQNYSNSMNT